MKPKMRKEDIFDLSQVHVDPTLRSHANDPCVRRKVEEAKRVLAPYLKELAEKRELADKSK